MKIPRQSDKKYKLSNDFECVKIDFNLYDKDRTLYIDQLESQIKEIEKLNGAFPDGLGDYEWKIIENFNSKNFRIAELEAENNKIKESSSILNTIGKDTPCPACNNKMVYKPRLYHCTHCGSDFN